MSSEERKLRRRRRREAKKQAISALRAQGCTCDVQIEFNRSDHPLAGMGFELEVSAFHDDWCPLHRVMEERSPDPIARCQLLLYPKDEA